MNSIEIVPPQGARIHVLRATVQLNRPWQEAIDAVGSNTPANYDVRKVDDLYPPTGMETIEGDYVLLNYPSGDGNWEKALAWAQRMGLKNTVPRDAFAIGKQHTLLHRTLGVDPMYVVATTDCTFVNLGSSACCVGWYGSDRLANLLWINYFRRPHVWFLFRK